MSSSDLSDDDRDYRRKNHCKDKCSIRVVDTVPKIAIVPSKISRRPLWSRIPGVYKEDSGIAMDQKQPKNSSQTRRRYKRRVRPDQPIGEDARRRALRFKSENPCSCPPRDICQCPDITYVPDSLYPVDESVRKAECFCSASGSCKCPSSYWGEAKENRPQNCDLKGLFSHESLQCTKSDIVSDYKPTMGTHKKDLSAELVAHKTTWGYRRTSRTMKQRDRFRESRHDRQGRGGLTNRQATRLLRNENRQKRVIKKHHLYTRDTDGRRWPLRPYLNYQYYADTRPMHCNENDFNDKIDKIWSGNDGRLEKTGEFALQFEHGSYNHRKLNDYAGHSYSMKPTVADVKECDDIDECDTTKCADIDECAKTGVSKNGDKSVETEFIVTDSLQCSKKRKAVTPTDGQKPGSSGLCSPNNNPLECHKPGLKSSSKPSTLKIKKARTVKISIPADDDDETDTEDGAKCSKEADSLQRKVKLTKEGLKASVAPSDVTAETVPTSENCHQQKVPEGPRTSQNCHQHNPVASEGISGPNGPSGDGGPDNSNGPSGDGRPNFGDRREYDCNAPFHIRLAYGLRLSLIVFVLMITDSDLAVMYYCILNLFHSQVGAFYYRRAKSDWERISSRPWYSTHHRGAQPFHCNENFPENQRAYRTRLDRATERTYLSKYSWFSMMVICNISL